MFFADCLVGVDHALPRFLRLHLPRAIYGLIQGAGRRLRSSGSGIKGLGFPVLGKIVKGFGQSLEAYNCKRRAARQAWLSAFVIL